MASLIYWFSVLDKLNGAMAVILIFTLIVLFGGSFMMLVGFDVDEWDEIPKICKTYKKYILGCVFTAIFSLLGVIFIPQTKVLVAMYVIPKIIENKNIAQLPDLTAKSAIKYLTDYLNTSKDKK